MKYGLCYYVFVLGLSRDLDLGTEKILGFFDSDLGLKWLISQISNLGKIESQDSPNSLIYYVLCMHMKCMCS